MKRSISIIIAVIFCLLMPITVSAKTYDVGQTDMSINIDDSSWYVFTRDNIKNNPELDELEIPYDGMYDLLHNNSAYLNAMRFYDDGNCIELFVRKNANDSGVANLSNHSKENVMKAAEGLAEKQNTEEYSVYDSTYKFARLEYVDPRLNYYICEFFTVINKENYTLTFQSLLPYDNQDYKEIEKIVDSIEFDIDPTLKEEINDSSFNWGTILIRGVVGGIVGGGVGGIIALINKKKKSKNKINDNTEPTDTTFNDQQQ